MQIAEQVRYRCDMQAAIYTFILYAGDTKVRFEMDTWFWSNTKGTVEKNTQIILIVA